MTSGRHHTDREYAAELRQLRENLLMMAGQVEQMIADSSRSLIEMDKELARDTIEADHRVNRIEVDTDEACLLILAKRQPMARDLRFITLAMKMVTDLERIGDLAVNISERTLALSRGPSVSVSEKITRMSTIAQGMVREAIDAFVARDADRAQAIFARDEEVDDLYRAAAADLQAAMYEDSGFVETGIHLKAVVKFLERIGDHATNLAELAVFLVKGKDIRHLGKLEPSRRPGGSD
jgi:phosphate transport system protein